MSGICAQMDGKKCMMEYCDFWDSDEQTCSLALESHKRVEILKTILTKAEELALKAKDKEELMYLAKELMITVGSKTIQ